MTPAIHELTVRDLSELVRTLTPRGREPISGRFRERAVYRGVADTRYSLHTSLDRVGMPDLPPHSKAHLEEHLLRHFIRHSRPYLPSPPSNEWELLVIAQHHGLPTRLLDWSYSPLTAAHFATIDDRRKTDRVIWRLDWGRMHERFRLPEVALMVEDLDRVLCSRGVHSPWELFGVPRADGEHFIALLEPPALDARIVAQSAAFTLSSDKTRPLDEILAEAGIADCLTRCIIPAASVTLIRDQLDLCSVDERRLFPDLDGVAAEIRRYYWASASGTGDTDAS